MLIHRATPPSLHSPPPTIRGVAPTGPPKWPHPPPPLTPIELNLALDGPSKEASPEIDQRVLPKFAECIPDSLLAQFASQRLYDWSAANEVCQMPDRKRV